jgi:hypothetical protein
VDETAVKTVVDDTADLDNDCESFLQDRQESAVVTSSSRLLLPYTQASKYCIDNRRRLRRQWRRKEVSFVDAEEGGSIRDGRRRKEISVFDAEEGDLSRRREERSQSSTRRKISVVNAEKGDLSTGWLKNAEVTTILFWELMALTSRGRWRGRLGQ